MAELIQRRSNIEVKKLITNLKLLQFCLRIFIPQLNSGGCLIFAYEISKILSKYDEVYIRSNMEQGHYVVQLANLDFYFDGHGFISGMDMVIFNEVYYCSSDDKNKSEIESYINDPHIWNKKYKRDKKDVMLGRFLKLFEKRLHG